jgi:hypothetical protein
MPMRVSGISLVAGVLLVSVPSFAQDYGPSQNRLWARIYRVQFPFTGLYTGRVDGRPNRKAGFPPSAADQFTSTVDPRDCLEINAFAPDAHPYWQARVRRACP